MDDSRSAVPEALSVAEAKRRFSELIDRVARGEEFVVAWDDLDTDVDHLYATRRASADRPAPDLG